MSIKLKAIELDSFRAYKDEQIFDFTNENGEIVNLVVIFAPNGFGKTSLLDAVEWGLSKEINRFSNNEVLKKITKKEKEVILKNRDSNKPYGIVKFVDDKDNTLVLNTKVRGRKYKSDYNEGVVIDESSELRVLRESLLSKDNILSHDKIDSFLLSSSGADRYEALSKFWDYSNDTQNYKTTYSLWNEIKKEVSDKNSNLKKINSNIKDIYIPMNDINLTINKINSFEIDNIQLNYISKELTKLELHEIFKTVINKKNGLSKKENEIRLEYNYINQLHNSFTVYQQQVKLHFELENKLKELDNNIKKINFSKILDEQNIILHKEYNNIIKNLEMINELKQKAIYFAKTNLSIVEKKEATIQNDKKIIDLKNINNQLSYRILEIQSKNEKNKKDFTNFIQEGKGVNQKLNQLKKLGVTLEKSEKRIARLIDVINKRTENLQDIKGKINEIDSLLISDETLINYEFKNNKYREMVDFLKEYILSLDIKRKQRKKKKEEYDQFGKLNDDLNDIRKLGRHFIQSSEKSECPLCSTVFPDVRDLIICIDKNIENVFNLKLIHEEIQELDRNIENQYSEYNNIYNLLKNKLKEELKETQEKNKIESQKLIRVNLNYESMVRQVTIIKEQLEELKLYFINHNPSFNNEDFDKDAEIIKENFLKIIKEKEELINIEQQQLNEYNELLNKNKELILSLEKQNIKNTSLTKSLELESDYQAIIQYLGILGISFGYDEIFEKENDLKEQLDLLEKKRAKVQLSIQENQFNQEDKELYELQVIFQNIKDEDNKCIEFIERYVENYKNYLKSTEVSETDLITKLNNINKDLELINELISYFDTLHEKLQYTGEVLENSGKVKERNDLIKYITELNKVETKINKLLKDSQKIIVEKINRAFNLNVINKIYSRIEPHPELKFMEIIPNFIDDKPSLEIYAPMGEERKDNPIIFFSSAQLDILSLSIFFAKALMEPEPILNTIFMDDPIHHMDSVNVLSFIDLLRTITLDFDRQIVLTTHNESLFRLIEKKMDPSFCNSKFIQLDSYGQINQSK